MRERLSAVVVALLMALMSAQVAHAEDHDRDRVAVTSFTLGLASISLSFADAIITYRAVKSGRAREANPLLVPFVETHGIGKTMIAKVGVDFGQELGLRYIAHRWPERKKTVMIARVAAVGLKGFVVAHNVHELRR
jgi:dipeptide/tripeptide permease